MDRVLKESGKVVGAAVGVFLAAIGLYLFALLNVYIIAWVVELLIWIFT